MKNIIFYLLILIFTFISSVSFAETNINDTTNKEYKFVFVLNEDENVISCQINSMQVILKQLQNINSNNKCFVIVETRNPKKSQKFTQLFPNTTIIGTDEKLDLSCYGIEKYPALMIYELGVFIKAYSNIRASQLFFNKDSFDKMMINLNDIKQVELDTTVTDNFFDVNNSPIIDIPKKELILIDFFLATIYKFNIDNGDFKQQIKLEYSKYYDRLFDTTSKDIGKVRLFKGKPLLEAPKYMEFFQKDNKFFTFTYLTTDLKKEKNEEVYNHILQKVIVGIDSNTNYSIYLPNYGLNRKDKYEPIFYKCQNNTVLANIIPIGNLPEYKDFHLISKFTNDFSKHELVFPFQNSFTEDNFNREAWIETMNFIDKEKNIFVSNTMLNIFAKIDSNDLKTNYKFQGVATDIVIKSLIKDTAIVNILKNEKKTLTYLDICDLNDSLFVALACVKSKDSSNYWKYNLFSMQIYTKKDGVMISEKLFKVPDNKEILIFRVLGIYNDNLLSLAKESGDKYKLYFMPVNIADKNLHKN